MCVFAASIEHDRAAISVDAGFGGSDSSSPSLTPTPMVELECKELWEKFDAIGTEMILTKAGR